jgi:threonine dehydratase
VGRQHRQVGDLGFDIAGPLIDEVLLVEEAYFETAVALYFSVEKTVAEGAGAASLAALLAYPDRFKGKKAGLDPAFEKGSDKKVAFNDKSVGVEPNEGAPRLSGKGVIGKLI